MVLSRTETNLRRLLAKCELMIKANQRDDERFPKYLESLENMLKQLVELPDKSVGESIADYSRRISNLRSFFGLEISEELRKYQLERSPFQNLITKEISDLSNREELLGLRQRQVEKPSVTTDLDELIDYNQHLQEKIAEEMLMMTRNLKEQSQLANTIIKKDTQIIDKSTQLSDQNFTKLKSESNKLSEHSKNAWKCWMWIMLLVVLMIFINMVLFMKITKKKH